MNIDCLMCKAIHWDFCHVNKHMLRFVDDLKDTQTHTVILIGLFHQGAFVSVEWSVMHGKL